MTAQPLNTSHQPVVTYPSYDTPARPRSCGMQVGCRILRRRRQTSVTPPYDLHNVFRPPHPVQVSEVSYTTSLDPSPSSLTSSALSAATESEDLLSIFSTWFSTFTTTPPPCQGSGDSSFLLSVPSSSLHLGSPHVALAHSPGDFAINCSDTDWSTTPLVIGRRRAPGRR